MLSQALTRAAIATLALPAIAIAAAPPGKPLPRESSANTSEASYDIAAAAHYLDTRETWWQAWPPAQKDHGTVCVSCHTQVPYALARPALRHQLGEKSVSLPEKTMLDSIVKRVQLGPAAGTFYTDADNGPGKTKEARNTEYVNNALILASYDSQTGHLQDTTRKAFDQMWATQENSASPDNPTQGAWVWQNFHFSPWEAPESEYAGAAMAALATGIAPDGYQNDPKIQPNLKLLRAYLSREAPHQPLLNRITLLWASAKLPGLMTHPEREALVNELIACQHQDGGWSLTDLGKNVWKRRDNTPFEQRSDGYATGIIVLALEENGLNTNPATRNGLSWLLANQNKTSGIWPAWSVNKNRDPNSDVGKFMADAATGYALLAIERAR